MTIGQRIAECRKKQGLSQEALGDRLGLSRQAVSKWEADAALPEIDKLIALSRMFGVTVGWLLGVEELQQPEQEPLTEEQLNAMEQLIQLYTAYPRKEEPHRPVAYVLAAIAAGIAAVSLALCISQGNQLRTARGNMDYQTSVLNQQISTLRERITALEIPESTKDTDSLHRYSFHLTPDKEAPLVRVEISALPKEWKGGESAVLSVRREGREIASAECVWDGNAYIGHHDLRLENGYEYWLILTDLEENRKQIPLEDQQAENLKDTFSLTCEVRRDQVYLSRVGGDLGINGLMFRLQRPVSMEDGGDYQWDSICVKVLRNGETVYTESILEGREDEEELSRSVVIEHSGAMVFHHPPTILQDGDGVEVWLIARVSNGMECKEMVGSWRYEENGTGGVFHGGEITNGG